MSEENNPKKDKKVYLRWVIIGGAIAVLSIPVYFFSVTVGVIISLLGGYIAFMNGMEMLPDRKPPVEDTEPRGEAKKEQEITIEYLYERIENLHKAVSGLVVSVVGSVLAAFLPIVGGIIALFGFIYALIFIIRK